VPRQQRSDETSRPWQVRLDTPTGTVDYQLPIAIDETYNSTQVSTFLSPPGVEGPDAAQIQRRSNRLLGLPIGDDNYRFPKFQIDEARRMIRPVVAYANQLLECDEDPWGTLDWWYAEDEALGGQRPVEMVTTGKLTHERTRRLRGAARPASNGLAPG
jgi:hypothetical protein